MGGASSLNFGQTLDEIFSYRQYSNRIGAKSLLIIKNKMRNIVLTAERLGALKRFVKPYLIIRQFRIHNKALTLNLPRLKLPKSQPYFDQLPTDNGHTGIRLVTFADGTFGFRSAGKRLIRQADKSAWFNSPSEHWTIKKIQSRIPDFAANNLTFMEENKRGLGLWIWKPAVLEYE